MKKIIICFCSFCLLFLFTGCQSENLAEEKVNILESNMKVDSILNVYNQNLESVKVFDSLLDEILLMEYDDVYEVLEDSSKGISSYFSKGTDYFSLILSLKGETVLDSNFNIEENIKKYAFLKEESGNIEELIVLKLTDKTFYITFEWENSQIQNVSIDRG